MSFLHEINRLEQGEEIWMFSLEMLLEIAETVCRWDVVPSLSSRFLRLSRVALLDRSSTNDPSVTLVRQQNRREIRRTNAPCFALARIFDRRPGEFDWHADCRGWSCLYKNISQRSQSETDVHRRTKTFNEQPERRVRNVPSLRL